MLCITAKIKTSLGLKSLRIIVCVCIYLLAYSDVLAFDSDKGEIKGILLTWQQDPTSTMTIDWHQISEGSANLRYRKADTSTWQNAQADIIPFPFSNRMIYRVELTGLDSDAIYEFTTGADNTIWKFRTLPQNTIRPIRFAVGGDIMHEKEFMKRTNKQAVLFDPDFVIWGGDHAYANGRQDLVERWYDYFDALKETLVTDDGRLIPVIAGIGNHEVIGGRPFRDDHELRQGFPPYRQDDDSRLRIAPYYYTLFAFPGQPGYSVLDFGDYMSIVLLDSEHSNPIAGIQTQWLEETLAQRAGVPHVFPVYHVPAYPSARHPDNPGSVNVREHWVPLFDTYEVKVAFENHDHTYKRTYPIRNGVIDSKGVVYIGDGAWGVYTRDIGSSHDEEAFYLERAASERHFIIVTIHGQMQHFLIVNEDGVVIDEYPATSNKTNK
jgi:acid phosphatase type 7